MLPRLIPFGNDHGNFHESAFYLANRLHTRDITRQTDPSTDHGSQAHVPQTARKDDSVQRTHGTKDDVLVRDIE